MRNIRRICFYGGPGSGKSTMAAYIFSQLKSANYNCEYVAEYIKFWTYLDKKPEGFDQVYTFAKHMYKVDTILRGGADFIVTDSPLMLGFYYAHKYNYKYASSLAHLEDHFEHEYRSLNIFLERGDIEYDSIGRYQDKSEALLIDEEIKTLFKYYAAASFSTKDKEKVFAYIIHTLEEAKHD